jgi:hypothetical protein
MRCSKQAAESPVALSTSNAQATQRGDGDAGAKADQPLTARATPAPLPRIADGEVAAPAANQLCDRDAGDSSIQPPSASRVPAPRLQAEEGESSDPVPPTLPVLPPTWGRSLNPQAACWSAVTAPRSLSKGEMSHPDPDAPSSPRTPSAPSGTSPHLPAPAAPAA